MDKKENRELNIKSVISQIQKQFGAGSIIRLGSKEIVKVDYIPTGAISLDVALGIGGIPRGRIIEIYGPESSGKTTLTLEIASNAQRLGGTVAFIDAEHALDPKYAKTIGVNTDSLYISQPDYGEQALEILDTLVRSGSIDLIVVDSVAALVPKAEIEGNMGDAQIGLQARLMSKALRKLTGIINRTQCTVIFINQLRSKIGVTFGSPEVTTGGNALKFYSSIRMDIRRIESLKKNDVIVGNHVRVKVAKNKLASPFKLAEFDIFFDRGISKTNSLIDIATSIGLIKRSGTWFSYQDKQLGQGKENVRLFLKENPEIQKNIYKLILEHFQIDPPKLIYSDEASEKDGNNSSEEDSRSIKKTKVVKKNKNQEKTSNEIEK